ncbi:MULTISPECIES: TonB-dependent receptor [Sphingomonadales]|uniref:TonB-dependent receptor n=2 Tax=Edaphosphingomonas TaxID=3423724 RepID=A0A2T4HLI8_9SPHN|nr:MULTISPECIES: TonB-dependent receptor [Sphingomonas]AGH48995.1 TonB-dependent receptor, plug [Sphingomonas sp. MM-1]OHT21414.1 Pesticin receptor precursor [Sphingomonas haloaromaticamans]PTD16673.1 TonB-dependent receptor [Sphingomonas fennica]
MRIAYLAAASALAMAANAAAIIPAMAQDAAADGSGGGLEDIVVTAQRREENLQKVPVAVTALSSEALDNARVVNVAALSGYAPNLQVTSQGQQSIPLFQIRGIASGASNNAVDPKVGVYLDGVYIGRSVGAIFDLADLQRVEVLRGPQGTLFGRNSTGGAVSLISANPTGEFGVRQQLSYGNYNAMRSRTVVDLPALGPLSVKLAYLHDEMEGDTDNLIAGKTLDFSQIRPDFGTLKYAKRLGGKNVDAFQLAARVDASDDLKIDYHFDYTDSRTSGRAVQYLGSPAGGAGVLAGVVVGFQPLTGGIVNAGKKQLDAVANATSSEHVITQGHNLTATWDVSDVLTVKSITAYRKFHQKPNTYDLSSSGGLRFSGAQLGALLQNDIPGIFDDANQPGPNDSFFALLTARETKQKQFTQETQFLFNWDRFDLTSGLFYFHENSPSTDVLGVMLPVANGVVTATPFDAIFGNGVTETRAVNDSMAGYAQLTWHATDQFDLAFGGRYTIDDRSTDLISVSSAQGGGLAAGQTYKTSYKRFNYTAIATYRPTDDVTTYAKVATGYVAGGILGAIPYDPEKLISYEAGVKSQLFGNRLRANLAAFYSDYKDMQVQSFENGVQAFRNAGKARIWGVEGEFEAVPLDGLTLNANFGYTNFKYKEYIQNGIDRSDEIRPTYTPKWTARLGGQYDFPEMANGGNFYVALDSRYRSGAVITEFSSGIPELDRLSYVKKYILADARAGIASLPIRGTEIGISGWVKNVFNVNRAPFGPEAITQVTIPDRGRTYGIDLSLKF